VAHGLLCLQRLLLLLLIGLGSRVGLLHPLLLLLLLLLLQDASEQ